MPGARSYREGLAGVATGIGVTAAVDRGAGEMPDAGRAAVAAGGGLDIRATVVLVERHVASVAASAAAPPRSRSFFMRGDGAFLVP